MANTITLSVVSILADEMEGTSTLQLQANTVFEALCALQTQYPRLDVWLWQPAPPAAPPAGQPPQRQFNPGLVAFVNNQNIRECQGLQTPLKSGDHLMLVSAIEGG